MLYAFPCWLGFHPEEIIMAKSSAKPSPGDRLLEASIQALEQKRVAQDGRLEVATAIATISTQSRCI